MNAEILSVTEAGKRLGISRPTAYKMVKTGVLPVLRFGRKIVVPTAVIDRMLQAENTSEAK